MNRQDQLEELLVDWELQRQHGNELSAYDLCKEHPDLSEELSRLIDDFKATDWLEEDDDSDEDFLHLPDFSMISNHVEETPLPESNVSVDEFRHRLVNSELMEQEQVDQLKQQFSTVNARTFAQHLVDDKKLTPFQATVLLEGREIPLVLDRYVLLGEIGKGGMGAVYKALHQQMDRVVALKILPNDAVDSPEKVKRFHREVKAAAKLHHGNIVIAHDAREDKGVHFLVMEYVTGSDLAALVRKQGPLSVAKSVDYIAQAARGLEHAHQLGIVHRDIKPGNLLLNKKGKVKILDMGLARIDAGETHEDRTVSMELTEAGAVMGTVAYLPPEQALDTRTADARSDIYALGCTLYFLLTGRAIFVEDTMMKTIMAHREQDAPYLCNDRESVPTELDSIFQKMVAKTPKDRFQSMTDLILALESLEIEEEDQTQPVVAGSQASYDTATFVDTSREAIEPQPATVGEPPKRRWGWMAACLLLVTGLYGAWASGIFLKVETPEGTIVLEIDQPELIGAVVSVDGEKKITIQTGEGQEPIEVSADEKKHTLKVVKGGFETFTKEFMVKAGGKQIIEVRLEPVAGSSKGAEWNDRKVAEWVLSIGGEIKTGSSINLKGDRYQMGDVLPSKLEPIKAIIIPERTFEGYELKRLSSLSSLTHLTIKDWHVHFPNGPIPRRKSGLTDTGLRYVAEIPGLIQLGIEGGKGITDNGLKPLTGLKHLEQLRFRLKDGSGRKLTDAAFKQLLPPPNLDSLEIIDEAHRITGTGLGRFHSLKSLILQSRAITPEGVRTIASLRELESLNLRIHQPDVDPNILDSLAASSSLNQLSLWSSVTNDEWLDSLKRLKQLQSIGLSGTKVTAQGVAKLQKALPNCKIKHEFDSLPGPLSVSAEENPHLFVAQELIRRGKKYRGKSTIEELPQGRFHISGFDHHSRLTDDDLSPLRSIGTVRAIGDVGMSTAIVGNDISDVGVGALSHMNHLRSLRLGHTKVSDEGVRELASHLSLERLALFETNITNSSCSYFANMNRLRVLGLNGTGIDDQGVAHLANHPTLHTLELRGTKVSPLGIEKLSNITNLRVLRLDSLPLFDVDIKKLAQLKQLHILSIRNTKITNDGAEQLQSLLPRCVVLHPGVPIAEEDRNVVNWLNSNKVDGALNSKLGKRPLMNGQSDEQVASAIRLKNSSGLEIANNLKNLRAIECLDLNRMKDADEAMKTIGTLDSLTKLTIENSEVTAEGMQYIKSLSQMESLRIAYNDYFDNESLVPLIPLQHLTSLGIPKTSVTSDGLVTIGLIKSLRTLILKQCPISSDGLKHLAQLSHLTDLDLTGTPINDEAIRPLSEIKTLRILDVRETRITANGAAHLQAALPKCVVYHESLMDIPWRLPEGMSFQDDIVSTDSKWTDRKVAEWVIRKGGVIKTTGTRSHIKHVDVSSLPDEDFKITGIMLYGTKTVSDDDLKKFRHLDALTSLNLTISLVTSNGLVHLSNLPNLQKITLTQTKIDDAGLAHLTKIRSIEYIKFSSTKVADEGLKQLADLPNLKHLDLSFTKVSNQGLESLCDFSKLETINLVQTKVTAQGIAELQKALPNCKIGHSFTDKEIKAASEGKQPNNGGETNSKNGESDEGSN